MLRFALLCLLALSAVAAVLLLLHGTDRQLDLASGQKLARMEQLSRGEDGIDLVTIGSSRTLFHLMPDVMDSTLAAHGHPARSFNYGLLGTPATEISYGVDRVLQADLPDLQTVVVELQPLPLRELHWHPLTRKGAYHFDAKRVAFGLQAARAADLTPAEARAAYARFLRLGLRHYTEAGQGTNLARSWLQPPGRQGKRQDARGFTPLARTGPTSTDQLGRVQERYDELLASLPGDREARPSAVDAVIADHFLGLQATAAEHGVRVLFMVQPMTTGLEGIAALMEREGAVVIRMNDPADYPALYDLELWYDGSHLAAHGARMLSDMAARAMAEALARADG